MVVVAVQQIVTFLLVLSAEAFIFESDACNRYHDYADLISLAHVENCLSVDQVFSKLKRLGDFQNQDCFRHVLNQMGDRYGVSVSIPEDCQCNGTNTLLTYEYHVIQGTADYRHYCMEHDLHYRALFDAFFKDNGNLAPACRSHHSVWYDLSRIQDNTCARDLIYHLKYAFDRHPSQCSCQQSLQYGDPNNCPQFHSYQALLRLKDAELCTSKNSQWDLLHDLELRSPVCRKDIITDLTMHFKNALAVDPCTCYSVASISNEEPLLEAGQLYQCSGVRDSSYNDLRQSSFGGASNTGCATHYHLWQQLQDIHDYYGYDCTKDFILRAANKYPSSAKDPCQCSGSLPTTTATTTTTTTTTTATSHSLTTTQYSSLLTSTTSSQALTSTAPQYKFQCRKYDLVADIATATYVRTNGSTSCGSKVSGTNEDLVLALCNMTSIDTWSRGVQVISNCDSIPHYSPVSTFGAAGNYKPLDAQSGIFLECIPNGFKMAIQPCTGGPQIVHVETNGLFYNNASNYYIVV